MVYIYAEEKAYFWAPGFHSSENKRFMLDEMTSKSPKILRIQSLINLIFPFILNFDRDQKN